MISIRWSSILNRWFAFVATTVVFLIIYYLATRPPQSLHNNVGLSSELKSKLSHARSMKHAVHKHWTNEHSTLVDDAINTKDSPGQNDNAINAKDKTPQQNDNAINTKDSPGENDNAINAKDRTPQQNDNAINTKDSPGQNDNAINAKDSPGQNDNAINTKDIPQQNDNAINMKDYPEQNDNAINMKDNPGQNDDASNTKDRPGQNDDAINTKDSPGQNELALGSDKKIGVELNIVRNDTVIFTRKKKKKRKKINNVTSSVNNEINMVTMGMLDEPKHEINKFESLPKITNDQLIELNGSRTNGMKANAVSESGQPKNTDQGTKSNVEALEVSRNPATLQSPTSLADLTRSTYPPVIVKSEGAFLDRVKAYNLAISKLREEILVERGAFKEWVNVVNASQLTVIWGAGDDFLLQLGRRPEVRAVILSWVSTDVDDDLIDWTKWSSLRDTKNIFIQNYYEWIGSAVLCMWIESRGLTKARWDAVYDKKCNTRIADSLAPHSIEYLYFNYKTINPSHYYPNNGDSYPRWFYSRPPPYVFYIHLIQDAVVNSAGDVIAGGVKIVPYTCSHDNLPTIPREYLDKPVYKEVFVLTQYWGASYFHKLIEVMPRIAPYLAFLQSNPTVHIHAPEDRAQFSDVLSMLGLNPERIVTGNVRAKIVYLPQGTPCGFPQMQSIQVLSKVLRDYIQSNLSTSAITRNNIVLVRRSGSRHFVFQEEIEKQLSDLARSHGLTFTVFADNPSPSFRRTMLMFASAVMVIAPHGAGLSNVVFSAPGTYVIEGVCNPPHVNMCFQMTAHILGHHYHGLASRGGCENVIDILPDTIVDVAREYLKTRQ